MPVHIANSAEKSEQNVNVLYIHLLNFLCRYLLNGLFEKPTRMDQMTNLCKRNNMDKLSQNMI